MTKKPIQTCTRFHKVENVTHVFQLKVYRPLLSNLLAKEWLTTLTGKVWWRNDNFFDQIWLSCTVHYQFRGKSLTSYRNCRVSNITWLSSSPRKSRDQPVFVSFRYFFLCLSCSPFFTRQVLIANTQNMKWVVHILSIESSQCVLCTSVRFCEGTSLPLNWNPFLKTRNPPFKSRSSAHFLFEFFIFERIFE